MKKAERELKAEVDRWFDEANESTAKRISYTEWIRAAMNFRLGRHKQKRLEKIRQAKTELEAEAKAELERGPDPGEEHHKGKPTGKPRIRPDATLLIRKVE